MTFCTILSYLKLHTQLLRKRLIKSQDFMGQHPACSSTQSHSSAQKSSAFYTKSPYCSKLKFMNKNERKKRSSTGSINTAGYLKGSIIVGLPKNTCSLTSMCSFLTLGQQSTSLITILFWVS